MAIYKKNPVLEFFKILLDIIKISVVGIGTLILLLLMGIFIAGLSVRNFIVKRRKNIRSNNE